MCNQATTICRLTGYPQDCLRRVGCFFMDQVVLSRGPEAMLNAVIEFVDCLQDMSFPLTR